MKLKVSKDAILEGLQKVQSIVSVRTTLPILQNILIKADKDKLWLSATDLEVSVSTTVAGRSHEARGHDHAGPPCVQHLPRAFRRRDRDRGR